MTEVPRSAVLDAARAFDAWLRFHRRIDRVPGVQAAVLHDRDIVLSTACGCADLEREVPVTATHRFRIASHSKTFTATAVLQLVERGQLRLDDTLGDHLPRLTASPVASVTMRELLAHASGITRDGDDGDFWQLARGFLDEAALLRLAADPAAAVLSPSERFKYSNIGYSLLGMVIEAVTGTSYAQHVRAAVIEPLDLVSTTPELQAEHLEQHVTGYSSLAYADRRIPIGHVTAAAMASATGFSSTADDLVRYAAAHFHGDTRLLSDHSKRLMQRREWEAGDGSAYGLGFATAEVAGRRVFGHGGGYPGHITRTWFDPEARLAVSVLTNAIDGPALGYANAMLRLLQLALDATPDPLGSDVDLTRFCGRFATLWGVFDIAALGGRLHQIAVSAPDPGLDPVVLSVVDADTLRFERAPGYASPGETMRYSWHDDGRVASVRAGSGSTALPLHVFAGAVFERERVDLGAPVGLAAS